MATTVTPDDASLFPPADATTGNPKEVFLGSNTLAHINAQVPRASSYDAMGLKKTTLSPDQGATVDLDKQIADKQAEIDSINKKITDLQSSGDPVFATDDEALNYQKEMIRAGAEAYMEYDPDTANKWLADAELMGRYGSGVMSERLKLQKDDMPSKAKMADLVYALRTKMEQDPTITKDSPIFQQTYRDVNIINGKMNFPLSATEMDNMFKQKMNELKQASVDAGQEQTAVKADTENEQKAYSAVKETVGALDQQFKDAATQYAKVAPALVAGASGENAGAYAAAVKSMIQSVDNSVVREGEMMLFNSPDLFNKLKSWIQGLVTGQTFTGDDQRRIWQAFQTFAKAINTRLDSLRKPALALYTSRLPQQFLSEGTDRASVINQGMHSIDALLDAYRVDMPKETPTFSNALFGSKDQAAPVDKNTKADAPAHLVEARKALGDNIESDIRTQAEQDALKDHQDEQGNWLTKEGRPVANSSEHLTGNAIDIKPNMQNTAIETWLTGHGWSRPLPDQDPNHWVHSSAAAKPAKSAKTTAKAAPTHKIGKFTVGK